MNPSRPTTIGTCPVCLARPRVISASTEACADCSTRHTRRWLALCRRAREDENFRNAVRAQLEPRARQIFDRIFPADTDQPRHERPR